MPAGPRRERIEQLRAAIQKEYSEDRRVKRGRGEGWSPSDIGSEDLLFLTLFGLPAELQIELAREMTIRYWPVYVRRHPEARWLEPVLANPIEYFRDSGPGLPESPAESHNGDPWFVAAVYLLGKAACALNNPGRLTRTCAAAVLAAIAARGSYIWQCDDPDAVDAVERGDHTAVIGRDLDDNVAARAVEKREWSFVLDWLEQHDVGSYPDADTPEREQSRVAWKEVDCAW